MVTINKIWFEGEWIYAQTEDGKILRQSLLWYPRLYKASADSREKYKIGYSGFHWKDLDEDISFESFLYPDADPSPGQRFLLTHLNLNIRSFAEKIGYPAEELYRYKAGFISPTPALEAAILSYAKP